MDLDTYLDNLSGLWAKNWPLDTPQEVDYPFGEVPLTNYLRQWAAIQPNKPAIIFYGFELTFGELNDLSDRFAALLISRRVKPGDRVAVFLPNCPQFLIAFYGILKAGAIHVPVNPLFKEEELVYELNDAGAATIVAQDRLVSLVRAVQSRTGLRDVFATALSDMLPEVPTIPLSDKIDRRGDPDHGAEDFLAALRAVTHIPKLPDGDLDAIAALNYTGGTTGMPKGCAHTQRNMLYTAATTSSVAIQLSDDDVGISAGPVFWIAGENASVILPAFRGISSVLLARWDPTAWMAAVERYRVTFGSLVLDSAVEIMEHPNAEQFDLSTLRRVRASSFVKKLNLHYREEWRKLTGTTLVEAAWGMTETHTNDTFTFGMQTDDMDLTSRPVFVGIPVPGTQVKICDFETGALLPLGAEGELCCRSPSLLKEYWNRPEATAEAIRDGWLHTGDIALIDEEGYLHFLGRRKEMLKVKGMSVFPAEIEALLATHPAVAGSGVIGRDDPIRGQVPVALVQILDSHRGKITSDDISAWCGSKMASYKIPEVYIVDTLPMTTTGKVRKADLPDLLERVRTAAVA